MLLAPSALFTIPFFVATVSGMQRLPAASVQISEPGGRELLAADANSTNVTLQLQESFYMGDGELPLFSQKH